MIGPRYRTLDGLEIELPVLDDRFVLVPRALANDEPPLTWTLEYHDVWIPEVGITGSMSPGGLLVPLERWNAQAAFEPALCGSSVGAAAEVGRDAPSDARPPTRVRWSAPRPTQLRHAARRSTHGAVVAADLVTRTVRWALAAAAAVIALSFLAAVVPWLLTLRDGMSGQEAGTGAALLVTGAIASRFARRAEVARACFRLGSALVAAAFAAFALGLA